MLPMQLHLPGLPTVVGVSLCPSGMEIGVSEWEQRGMAATPAQLDYHCLLQGLHRIDRLCSGKPLCVPDKVHSTFFLSFASPSP